MKVIVLHGSPRKHGDSDTLATSFLKGMAERVGYEVQHFYTNEMNISPYQGCLTCATAEDHCCAIEDDMEAI